MPPSPTRSPASSGMRQLWRRRRAAWLLWPLSLLFRMLTALRRALYASGLLRREHPGVPVVVIGNVIAGGAGKTPVTLATVRHLQARGWKPGIISRGYGRDSEDCREALPHSRPEDVGDEPLLMARSSGVPVFVAEQRIDAAHTLLQAYPEVDVLLCDDGLQHYALARDVEVCVFNDEGVGNGWLLPAGPLREAWPREVDAVLHAGPQPPRGTLYDTPCFAVERTLAPYALTKQGQRIPLHSLHGKRLHAVAAIARPEDFFGMLRAQSLELRSTEGLPDHYNFEHWHPPGEDELLVLCTEKDAVKIWQILPYALAIPLEIEVEPGYFDLLDTKLRLSSPY